MILDEAEGWVVQTTTNNNIMKKRTLTLDKLKDGLSEIENSFVTDDGAGTHNDFPGNCGMGIVYDLYDKATVIEQIYSITKPVDFQESNINYKTSPQVVFSDSLKSKAWKAAKSVAKKGPVTINPSSGNPIQHYTITLKELKKLVRMLPATQYKRYFN
jgi:hypothetical protein